jgi:hypothetical protein
VNPTRGEALTMTAVQVITNDVAVGLGGAGGYLKIGSEETRTATPKGFSSMIAINHGRQCWYHLEGMNNKNKLVSHRSFGRIISGALIALRIPHPQE